MAKRGSLRSLPQYKEKSMIVVLSASESETDDSDDEDDGDGHQQNQPSTASTTSAPTISSSKLAQVSAEVLQLREKISRIEANRLAQEIKKKESLVKRKRAEIGNCVVVNTRTEEAQDESISVGTYNNNNNENDEESESEPFTSEEDFLRSRIGLLESKCKLHNSLRLKIDSKIEVMKQEIESLLVERDVLDDNASKSQDMLQMFRSKLLRMRLDAMQKESMGSSHGGEGQEETETKADSHEIMLSNGVIDSGCDDALFINRKRRKIDTLDSVVAKSIDIGTKLVLSFASPVKTFQKEDLLSKTNLMLRCHSYLELRKCMILPYYFHKVSLSHIAHGRDAPAINEQNEFVTSSSLVRRDSTKLSSLNVSWFKHVASEYNSPITNMGRSRDSRDIMVDPSRVICRYELHGKCNDKNCKFQHFSQKNYSGGNVKGNLPSEVNVGESSLRNQTESRISDTSAPCESIRMDISDSERKLMIDIVQDSQLINGSNQHFKCQFHRNRYFTRPSSSSFYKKLTEFDNKHMESPSDKALWMEHAEFILRSMPDNEVTNQIGKMLGMDVDDSDSDSQVDAAFVRRQCALHILAKAVECNKHDADIWLAYLNLLNEHGQDLVDCRKWVRVALNHCKSFGLYRYCRNVAESLTEQLEITGQALSYVLQSRSGSKTSSQVLELIVSAAYLAYCRDELPISLYIIHSWLNIDLPNVTGKSDLFNDDMLFPDVNSDCRTSLTKSDYTRLWLLLIHLVAFKQFPSVLFNGSCRLQPGPLQAWEPSLIPWAALDFEETPDTLLCLCAELFMESLCKSHVVDMDFTPLLENFATFLAYRKVSTLNTKDKGPEFEVFEDIYNLRSCRLSRIFTSESEIIAWAYFVEQRTDNWRRALESFTGLSHLSLEVLYAMYCLACRASHKVDDSSPQHCRLVFMAIFCSSSFDVGDYADGEILNLAEFDWRTLCVGDATDMISNFNVDKTMILKGMLSLSKKLLGLSTDSFDTKLPSKLDVPYDQNSLMLQGLFCCAIAEEAGCVSEELFAVFEKSLARLSSSDTKRLLRMEYLTCRISDYRNTVNCSSNSNHDWESIEELLEKCITQNGSSRYPVTISPAEQQIQSALGLEPQPDWQFFNAALDTVAKDMSCVSRLGLYFACVHVAHDFNVELIIRIVYDLCQANAHSLAADVIAAAIYITPRAEILWEIAYLLEVVAGKIPQARWMLDAAREQIPNSLTILKQTIIFESVFGNKDRLTALQNEATRKGIR